MRLEQRIARLEVAARESRDSGDIVIASEMTNAWLEVMFDPGFQERKMRLPAGVKWEPPTSEGATLFLLDDSDDSEEAAQRRRERIARADTMLKRFGV